MYYAMRASAPSLHRESTDSLIDTPSLKQSRLRGIIRRNARNIGEMCTFSTTLFCHSPHWSEILRLSFHGFSAATLDFYLS